MSNRTFFLVPVLTLPITAKTQEVWDVAPKGGAHAQKGSWGGHCVFVPKYDQHGFTCITWGQLKTMTLAFWKKYCDEAIVYLTDERLTNGKSLDGFDLIALRHDLAGITSAH